MGIYMYQSSRLLRSSVNDGCAGFGNGDEAAEAALLARLVQERPVRSEQLLSHSGARQDLPEVWRGV